MADIIEFQGKDKLVEDLDSESIEGNIVPVIQMFLQDLDSITDLMIIYKTKDKDINLIHSGLDTRDKSYIIQLLQRDVFEDFGPTEII